MQVDTTTPLLVLRRSLSPLQHGALAVARSAGRLGIPVYSVRTDRREPATASRYIRGPLCLPRDGTDEQWIEALMKVGQDLDGAVLLPIDDRAAVTVGDHQEQLAGRFRLAMQPRGLQRRLASKRELWRLCNALHLPTPRSSFPGSARAAAQQAAESGYPVVLKRSEPWLAARDARAPSVLIAHNEGELLRGYTRMDSPVAPQVMVQEYIPGTSDTIWMFNGYFDSGSTCLYACTGRKLRQRPARTGPTTLGVTAANERVAEAAKRLLGELEYHGIVDMGFRYDARDDQYKLLDVNPRLGSTFRLFVDQTGIDVVRALHLDLTGREVPRSVAIEGRKWLNEPSDAFTFGKLVRDRELGLGPWIRSLERVQETAWWARDDPLPFIAMGASMPSHAIRGLARHRRQRAAQADRELAVEPIDRNDAQTVAVKSTL